MPINPNVAQPMVEATTEELDQAYSMQNMIEGGVNPHIAENIVDTKVLQEEVAQLKSILNEKNDKLRNSRILNGVLGGVAVAAVAVAVLNPFGGNDKDTSRNANTPVAAKTAKPNKTVESNSIFGKLGNAFKVKEAEAKATPASSAKTTEDKLQDRIEHADKATSVAFAVKRANPTHSNVKEMIAELGDGKNIKKADNQRDAWGSLKFALPLKKVTSPDAALGVVMNAEANKAVAIGTANILNHKDATATSNMTKEQAMRSIVEDLTKKGTKFERTVISGTENHGFNGKSIYSAGISENIPVLKVTVDGKAEYFKLVCLNGQNKLVRVSTPKETTTTTTDEPTPKKRTPMTSVTEIPDKNPTPKPEDKPEDKPKEEKPKEEKPKDCPPGYVMEDKCRHPKASGPPKEANQAPRPQPGTAGTTPGRAEAVDATQHGDQDNLNSTPHGTEAPDGAPGGGSGSVVSEPGAGAQTNPEHQPGSASTGTSEGTNDSATDPQTQTGATGETAGAGSAPGNH